MALEKIDGGDAFRAFNLGTETGHSVREVLQCVEKVSGRKLPSRTGPRRPGDPPRLVASAARIRQELGFEPKLAKLETIVETALRWRVDHPKGYPA
jgi:UDP-glucose 4-epimerase